jgi:hypothetical protein
MSLRSFSARSGKTAEEIKKLDYCREGLRRMRLGQTKKKINTKAKNLEKKKNTKKEKEEETRNQSSSGASASTACSVDATAEGANTSAAAVEAKEEEEEESDATIADEACREDAAMALMLIAKATT